MTAPTLAKPSAEEDLKLLKDFQRSTLDRVFQRLYLDENPTRRFLLADEVGLGKTLVARGVITRVIEHLWDKVQRIDVLYLCSNSDIARQNVSRLTPRGIKGVSHASRITLLPVATSGIKENKVNVVALTPKTSLELKGNLGIKRERALILHMLREHWNLELTGACRVFCGTATLSKFRSEVFAFGDVEEVDPELWQRFLDELDQRCRISNAQGELSIRARLETLVAAYGEEKKQSAEVANEKNQMIGELRQALAKVCIDALEPDLIILDEFQRFKDLLDGKGSAGEMAKQLFAYKDATTETRVLLLSATPYKMYTNIEEADGEDHYQDFIRTARFLLEEEPGEADRLGGLLKTYRQALFGLGQGGGDDLTTARDGIQEILRKVIVRTERLAVTPDRDGMLVERHATGVALGADDARGYVDTERIARQLKHPDTMEFWKSSSWLPNFMDQYKLGVDLGKMIELGGQPREFVKAVEAAERSLLPWPDVAAFRRLDPAHGRLRWLIEHTLDDDLWRVLWLPPSLRYYQLGEPFATVATHSPTKALLFSAWRVVPRVVAALLSHEAERRMYVASEGAKADLTDAPERLGDLLQVSRKRGRAAGLTVLTLLYPSPSLASSCDPMQIAGRLHATLGRIPTVEEILSAAEAEISGQLSRIVPAEPLRTTPDESWYWAAPILLDRLSDSEPTSQWWQRDLAELWSHSVKKTIVRVEEEDDDDASDVGEDAQDEGTALRDMVQRAALVASGKEIPSGVPPKDLLRTLALMALAGPATLALRSFARIAGDSGVSGVEARDAAATVGGAFRTLYNQPDSTAIIRASASAAGRTGDYWKQCLEYGVSGCLQAVLDEYTHLLVEEAGVFGRPAKEVVKDVAEYMVTAIGLRRAKVGVHNITVKNGSVRRETETFRSRFAMRYGEESADESGDKVRADDVRRAFNSPFWPFVLATTSVGQEGLDFHQYCHKVVHWNLPPNPVDLEQREGRVHRFKGHAVRKNVARKHADVWRSGRAGDPWIATFDEAKRGRKLGENDLIPYWVYPIPDGASIERHVPMYPLSREVGRLAALKNALAMYRMVFGQPRQEELLAYLERVVPKDQMDQVQKRLMISLAP